MVNFFWKVIRYWVVEPVMSDMETIRGRRGTWQVLAVERKNKVVSC